MMFDLRAIRIQQAANLEAVRAQQAMNYAIKAQIKLNNDSLKCALHYNMNGTPRMPKKEFIDPLRYC